MAKTDVPLKILTDEPDAHMDVEAEDNQHKQDNAETLPEEAPKLGRAVPRRRLVASKDENKEEAAADEAPATLSSWQETPSVHNQHLVHPETVKFGEMIVKVLTLDDNGLKEYQSILSMASRVGGPAVKVIELDRHFHEGSFVIYIIYQHMLYRKLNITKDDIR